MIVLKFFSSYSHYNVIYFAFLPRLKTLLLIRSLLLVEPKCLRYPNLRTLIGPNPANQRIPFFNSLVVSPNIRRCTRGMVSEVTNMVALLPFNNFFQLNSLMKWNANSGSQVRSKRPLRRAGMVDHQDG